MQFMAGDYQSEREKLSIILIKATGFSRQLQLATATDADGNKGAKANLCSTESNRQQPPFACERINHHQVPAIITQHSAKRVGN